LTCDGNTIHVRWYDRASMPKAVADHGDPPVDNAFGNAETIPWQEETIPVGAAPTEFYREVFGALVEGKPFEVSLEEARAVVDVTERSRLGTGF
jgi:hypothetical protein